MPSDHPNSGEQKAASTKLIWIRKNEIKPHNCLISFPMDIFLYVDWHMKKAADEEASVCGCNSADKCFGKDQG